MLVKLVENCEKGRILKIGFKPVSLFFIFYGPLFAGVSTLRQRQRLQLGRTRSRRTSPRSSSWPAAGWPASSSSPFLLVSPILRTDSKNLAKHPPKWWGRHLVHAFPFSGEYQANVEKSHIFYCFGAVLPSKWSQNFKSISTNQKLTPDQKENFS